MQGGDVTGADPVAWWATLDRVWHEAFRQAWEALTTGNIVGAVVADDVHLWPRLQEIAAARWSAVPRP